MMKAYEVNVRGKVQRVGYRRYLLDAAQELGLSGYVENKPDGTVYIFIQGPEEKVKDFLDKARKPSYPAKVSEILINEAEPNPDHKYFKIKYGKLEEELQEGFGAIQSTFTEYWREFRDYRNEFRNYRDEFTGCAAKTDANFKTLMDKYGEISEKLTSILETLTRESRETREILLENIKLLKEAIEKLSQKP